MRERVLLERAYLLHHIPYRDTSRILELLSAGHGRVAVVARGVRRPSSALRSVLRPFRPLLVSWTGRGELGTLTGAESQPGAAPSRKRLMSAWYVTELVMRLVQKHDPQPELFHAYELVLQGLVADDEARTLRLFEKRLLEALGYGLNLGHDIATGEPLLPERTYLYGLEQGPEPVEAASAQALVFRGASLLSLAREELTDTGSLADARRLLRAALDLYLGERPLRSRQVMRALRRQESRNA